MRKILSSSRSASAIGIAALVLLVVWYRDHTAPRREAQEVWRKHERVLSDAAMGRRINLDDFEEAVRFFENITKITVPVDHSTIIDTIPTKDTAKALEPLRQWYSENRNRLYWDEKQYKVRLTPE